MNIFRMLKLSAYSSLIYSFSCAETNSYNIERNKVIAKLIFSNIVKKIKTTTNIRNRKQKQKT